MTLAWRLLEAQVWSGATLQAGGSWIELRKCYFDSDLMVTFENQGFSHTSGFLASLTESGDGGRSGNWPLLLPCAMTAVK